MSLSDIFPLEKLILIHTQLKIMSDRKHFPQALLHRNTSVLNNCNQQISGIHQCSKQQVIKVIINFFPCFFFPCKKTYFFFLREQNPCCFRTGERQGDFSQTFKFFNMPWVIPAGIAEHFRPCFCVNVTQIFFIQECTAAVILTENLFFPVDIIVEAITERSFKMLIFFQRFLIYDNLPARTAGIRTGSCNAGKFFIVIWKCKLHGITLLPFVFS